MTPYMAVRPHLQNYLRMVSLYAIATAPYSLELALKKITTVKKRCTIRNSIGNSSFQYLLKDFIISTTIVKKFAYAEANR